MRAFQKPALAPCMLSPPQERVTEYAQTSQMAEIHQNEGLFSAIRNLTDRFASSSKNKTAIRKVSGESFQSTSSSHCSAEPALKVQKQLASSDFKITLPIEAIDEEDFIEEILSKDQWSPVTSEPAKKTPTL
mmetsp:Transcript_12198/g.18865  ORF Transcript_12198/g.18865 Transcript_12198/m.18865 type:complete len:132 (+) Transcript_12198:823-1218(+)